MRHVIGYLIRHNRLAQNLSQESLCKGICAVSYLSKIEQGQVEPGKEIVRLLFAALGIDFEQDEAYVARMRQAFTRYYDRLWHGEDVAPEETLLLENAPRLTYSVLHVSLRVLQAYHLMQDDDIETALAMLQEIRPYWSYMDREDAFFYSMIYADLVEDLDEKLAEIARAKVLRHVSFAYYQEARIWNTQGKYQEALAQLHEGFRLAADEGNIWIMRNISLLEGICYANLFNQDLMLHAFARAAALSRGDEEMQASIAYNIGATLLEMRAYDEALAHLLSAVEPLKGTGLQYFLLCHKLAIAYGEMGQYAEGEKYLREAQAVREEGEVSEMLGKALDVVKLRYTDGYLDNDEYLTLLREVYDHIMESTAFGYKQFHGLFLIDAYTHRRKYKEALAIAREINLPLS